PETTAAPPPIPVYESFNTVVSIFNKAMPSFLGDSANPEVQRKKLYDGLDNDIKKYLDDVARRADDECNHRWRAQRLALEQELESMRERLNNMEESGSEKGKELLSAQRQKRAMNERIRDLESKITQLEAEKEQYELENRSLVNKLRVSNVVNEGGTYSAENLADSTAYEARIIELENQIKGLDENCNKLNEKCNQLTDGAEKLSEENESLKAENTRLESDNREAGIKIKELNEQLEVLKIKTDMSDVMLNDLNSRASSSKHEVEERDATISSLQEELNQLRANHEITVEELAQANANLEIAAQIHSEIDKIHEILSRKNTQINDLNNELRRRDERINALEAEEKSLKHTIETNLQNQANSEKALNEEIEQLRQSSSSRDKRNNRRKNTPHISAIDEDLDNTDWLIATPPAGKNARTPGVTDSEFGYQEPHRNNPPENSAQMSLW
ncbi:MAG: hypothetical protein K2G40_01945, partial [Muribaculaceae bacterium]|nr:hypothetical protein [Muribaculaceae bacterium]